MKKLDKLILSSFLGPFFLTFLVVVFILLTQHMLKYFDDIVGKDLGWDVLAQLFFHFAVFMTPIAIPLAILLSSLMTFGNLGEHFELTAIKSAGISLLRALLPIFIFVLGLTVIAFYSNNYFVPKSALEAYSLLYDIKQKKPALDLKQGAFYNGIPDFSIKVNKKHKDGRTLEDIIIYDHRNQNGNKKVTLADSGAMYTILDDRFLKLELFNGHFYFENTTDGKAAKKSKNETLSR
ncbi:MAG: LptF/LptG family permease, partial [Cytophagales bacterium]|nr:LptF/LptG family permease [Cytophagales bacterium]